MKKTLKSSTENRSSSRDICKHSTNKTVQLDYLLQAEYGAAAVLLLELWQNGDTPQQAVKSLSSFVYFMNRVTEIIEEQKTKMRQQCVVK